MEQLSNTETRVPCPYCKEPILEGAIKCKHCGTSLRRPAAFSTDKWIWARNQSDRKLLGVASCIAANLNASATLIRLIFLVLAFVGGSGIIIYLLLAAVIPAEPGQRSLFEAAVDALGAALDNFRNQPSSATTPAASATTPPAPVAPANTVVSPEHPTAPGVSSDANPPNPQSV